MHSGPLFKGRLLVSGAHLAFRNITKQEFLKFTFYIQVMLENQGKGLGRKNFVLLLSMVCILRKSLIK